MSSIQFSERSQKMAANNTTKRLTAFVLVSVLLLLLPSCERGGGNVQYGSTRYNVTEVFGNGTSALALAKAAGRGDEKEIDRLIAEGTSVNTVGQHGITPLWWALWIKNYEGFSALLDRGANPNAQRVQGDPIMILAADMNDARFLAAALKHGGDPNLRDARSGKTPLFSAVLYGYKQAAELLLAAKADVNVQMPVSRETLPMVAVASRADYELVYRLFESGSDPTLKDIHGNTVADTIAFRSVNASNNGDPWREKVLEYLRNKGITANKPTNR
jgi:uncharacterized protein